MNKFFRNFLTVTCWSLLLVPTTSVSSSTDTVIISQGTNNTQKNFDTKTIEILLQAEIALNRNMHEVGLEKYLQATKLTKDPAIAQATVELASDMQNQSVAQKAAVIWADSSPNDIQAQLVGIALTIDNNYAKALEYIKNIFKYSKEESDDLLVAVHAKLSEKGAKRLVKAVSKIAETDIKNAYTFLATGQLYAQQGDSVNSQKWASKSLELKPELTRGIQLQARLISHKDNNDSNALVYLEEQLNKYSTNHELRIFYANALLDNQKIEKAKKHLHTVSESEKFASEALSKLGEIYYQESNFNEAKNSLLKATQRKDSNFNKNSYLLGLIFEKSNNVRQAVKWYTKIPPGDLHITGHLRAANLLIKEKEYGDAINTLHIAQPRTLFEQKQLINTEISVLIADKKLEEALEMLNEILLYLPVDTELLYTRALVLNNLNHKPLAIADLEKIISINPIHVPALNSLGYLLIEEPTQHAKAEILLKQALELEPNNPAILDSLGWLYFKIGKLDNALEYLQKAASLKQDPEIFAHLGAVLWQLGKQDKAKAVWLEGLANSPNDPFILSTSIKNCNCNILQ